MVAPVLQVCGEAIGEVLRLQKLCWKVSAMRWLYN
jgi:hypothetical protein